MATQLSSVSKLAEVVDGLKQDAKRVIHCHGVFDLLHIGHIRYLQQAAALGDVLLVTLTPDRFVNKGPHRPAFPEQLRASALAALDCVDYVAINESPTATELIEQIRPGVFCKGAEFRDAKTPELLREEAACINVGAAIEFIEDITSSSSYLINNFLGIFPEELEAYLQHFRQRHSTDSIAELLDGLRDLKVLVVGEAIIDEYYECATIGRSERAPIVATRYESHARYAGGALAVANHVAAFAGQVELVTMLGADDTHEAWIRDQLDGRIRPTFVTAEDRPTIVKRRYRESYFNTPLFEMDFYGDQPLDRSAEQSLQTDLAEKLQQADVVLIPDYGHLMLGQSTRSILIDSGIFTCVMPQATASNTGLHTIGKYRGANFAQLAQGELELESRRRAGDVPAMTREVSRALDIGSLIVTLGKRGCLSFEAGTEVVEAPSLALQVVDRFGAGEAFFAIASLAAVANAPADLQLFLGNAAAAEAVSVVGQARFLERTPFERHLNSLLK